MNMPRRMSSSSSLVRVKLPSLALWLLGACVIDGDHYKDLAAEIASGDRDGDGHADLESGGDDCEDLDDAIHPGAEEVYYDGVDQDCDSQDDYDADGDGERPADFGGSDCDDEDPEVSSLKDEGWHDLGTDNDCDGVLTDAVVVSLDEADLSVTPPGDGGGAGYSLGVIPELSDDGLPTIWLSAPRDSTGAVNAGATYLIPSSELLASGDLGLTADSAALLGPDTSTYLNAGAVLSDDEDLQLALGGAALDEGVGAIWRLSRDTLATLEGPTDISTVADTVIRGEDGSYLGGTVLSAGDMDGDGLDELITSNSNPDGALIFSGDTQTDLSIDDADGTWTTGSAAYGMTPTLVGDVDDDGRADLALTAIVEDRLTVGAGVVLGSARLSSGVLSEDAHYRFVSSPVLGRAYAVDATSIPVFVALEWQASFFTEIDEDGTYDALTDSDYNVYRTEDEGPFIGMEDLGWIGTLGTALDLRAPLSPIASATGECWVVRSSELASEVWSSDLQVSLQGSSAGDGACQASVVTDLDGDTAPDLLIGAPGVDGAAEDAGRVYGMLAP